MKLDQLVRFERSLTDVKALSHRNDRTELPRLVLLNSFVSRRCEHALRAFSRNVGPVRGRVTGLILPFSVTFRTLSILFCGCHAI